MTKNVNWPNICKIRVAGLLTFCCVITLYCAAASSATWNIYYPQPEDELDLRTTYPLAVLALALDHTGVRYNLVASQKPMGQGRSIKQLKANREISLVWSMTDRTREQELLPVRIPIYKGLIGWRIFLVKPQYRDTFRGFTSLEELRQYLPVQGHDWPDTRILRANGFEVVTGTGMNDLYTLVDNDRANFFPRSVVEIWEEVENNPYNLVVEPHIAIRYPTATYFFVNKKNVVLARLLETGFRRAIASGEFDRLFYQIHETYLSRANLGERLTFELNNPILPAKTPTGDSELWYDGQPK